MRSPCKQHGCDERKCRHTLQWRHNGCDDMSIHRPHNCLLNRLFRQRWKKTSKLRVTGLCEGNSPVTSEFPAQRASNTENVSIWWRHHVVANSQKYPTLKNQLWGMSCEYWKQLIFNKRKWKNYCRMSVPIRKFHYSHLGEPIVFGVQRSTSASQCTNILLLQYLMIERTQHIMIHMKLPATVFLKINQNAYFFPIRSI